MRRACVFPGVHSRRICVPIYSPVRIDVTSRGAEEGQSVSGRKLRAEERKTIHDTFAGRRSDGGSRRLRFRSVSRQELDVILAIINSAKFVYTHGNLVPQRAALSDAGRKRDRERTINGRRVHFAKMMLHLTGMVFADYASRSFSHIDNELQLCVKSRAFRENYAIVLNLRDIRSEIGKP